MTNEDINKKVESVVNSIEFIEDEDYKYLHKYSVEIEIKKCIEEIETLRTQLAKANERVKELEVRYSELRNKVGISSANIELEMNNKNHRNKILSQAKIEVLQKIKSKAVDLMHKNWIISQSPSVEKLMEQPVWLSTDIIDSEIEQLRKEQTND